MHEEVIAYIRSNAIRAQKRWEREKKAPINEEHLLIVLVEEVGELAAAVMNKHEHTPSYELIQIGGIVVNWLSQIDESEVSKAFTQEAENHP